MIKDFGQKIGGARKDLALSGPPTIKEKPVDERPAWRRLWAVEPEQGLYDRYLTAEARSKPTGKFVLAYRGEQQRRTKWDTAEEAEKHIPFAEVSRNHRVRQAGDDTWFIYRMVGEHKRPVVKGGFATEDDALRHMATHTVEVIEHVFEFPDVPWLEDIQRIGPSYLPAGKSWNTFEVVNVSPAEFQAAFGFRGGEFGNWNMGAEGQAALNHAFNALHDLARVLQVEPRTLSLNGQLAIAFGARGHGGKVSARAHYEMDFRVINLTKIRGAGSLAHEWMHALDHYLHDPAKYGEGCEMSFACERALPNPIDAGQNASLKALVNGMMAHVTSVPIDPAKAAVAKERLEGRCRDTIARIRTTFTEYHQWRKNRKAPTAKQLEQFDALAERIVAGDVGEKKWQRNDKAGRFNPGQRSCDRVIELNALYKEVTGASFHKGDSSNGHDLVWAIEDMAKAKERNAEATAGAHENVSKRTQFYDDARAIDGYRASDYWSLKHEMLARAFAAYVYDRLQEKGERSDYLVYGAENRFYVLMEMKPYPEGEERPRINALFDTFFKHYRQPGLLPAAPEPAKDNDMARFNPLKPVATAPINTVIEEINARNAPPGGWTEKDKIKPAKPAPAPVAVADQPMATTGTHEVAIKQAIHTKRQCPIWIARLGDRVERAEFNRVRDIAKQQGGYWSNYGPADIHGFIFFEQAHATAFRAAIQGTPEPVSPPVMESPAKPVVETGPVATPAAEISPVEVLPTITDDPSKRKRALEAAAMMRNQFNRPTFAVWDMAGDWARDMRQRVMTHLYGHPATKAESGVTNITVQFCTLLEIPVGEHTLELVLKSLTTAPVNPKHETRNPEPAPAQIIPVDFQTPPAQPVAITPNTPPMSLRDRMRRIGQ